MSRVLGLSLGHDSSAAVVQDGEVVEIREAERWFRQKRYKLHAHTLESGNRPSGYQQVDVDDLRLFTRHLIRDWGTRYDAVAVQNQGRDEEYQNLVALLREEGIEFRQAHHLHHHLSHAAGAFYTSPFEESLILSFDGMGNDGYTLLFRAGPSGIEYLRKIDLRFGSSYNNLGYIVGVKPDVSGTSSGKTMGLASYGTVRNDWMPCARKYVREYRRIAGSSAAEIQPYGAGHVINSVGLDEIPDLQGFVYDVAGDGGGSLWRRLTRVPGRASTRRELRMPGVDHPLSHDLCKTVQAAWTEEVLGLLKPHAGTSGNLCVTGGCALNGITNYAIQRSGLFTRTHFVPNPSDCGLAAGAALDVAWRGRPFSGLEKPLSAYLGGEAFDKADLPTLCERWPHRVLDPASTPRIVAARLAEGLIVGVIRGRYEIGPRALGNRSILCNPLLNDMRQILNEKVKHREWYRPFAPVVTEEDASRFFTNVAPIPYMSVICETRSEHRERLPSVTHVDGTARLQTIARHQNPFLYATLREFEGITGYPILLNTSFNPGGEPILNFIAVGLEMLETTQMDLVLVDDTLVARRGRQDSLAKAVA